MQNILLVEDDEDLAEGIQMAYSFPWTSHLAVFLIILVLCMLVPTAIYSRTQKGSVIERLQNWE